MTDRREAEADAAPGPTTADTLTRLREDDASVAEFVAAGGLSAFRPLTTYYVARVVEGHPIQSFDSDQLFSSLDDAVIHAKSLAPYGRYGVFELVTKAVFE